MKTSSKVGGFRPALLVQQETAVAANAKEQLAFLVIADDLVGPTKSRRKTNTIRAGFRDVRPGPFELRPSSGGDTIPVHVVEVAHKKASQVTNSELRANGFTDMAHMLSGMTRFYPDFGPDSEVTVVSWR